jgi:hypothetical protein
VLVTRDRDQKRDRGRDLVWSLRQFVEISGRRAVMSLFYSVGSWEIQFASELRKRLGCRL